MNAGKTTTIRAMARGFAQAGHRPGVTKVTGTGSGNDYWVMIDAGAHLMLDFTDAGLASTFRQPLPRLERAFAQLVSHLTLAGCRINFVEIADGIFQRETSALLRSATFHGLIDGVVLAASDAMGAAHGTQVMQSLGIDVLALSGLMTRSPLAAREAHDATGLPVADLDQLMDATHMSALLGVDRASLTPVPDALPPAWPIEVAGLDIDTDEFDLDSDDLVDSRSVSLEAAR
ncbi:MAG: hypothetical protein Q4G43_12210 [Mobilicoccus sp.]|nr:hypothetical protein [Mobilicoccus sp.]